MIYILYLMTALGSKQLDMAYKLSQPLMGFKTSTKFKMVSKGLKMPYDEIPLNEDAIIFKMRNTNEIFIFTDESSHELNYELREPSKNFILETLMENFGESDHFAFATGSAFSINRKNYMWAHFDIVVGLNKKTNETSGRITKWFGKRAVESPFHLKDFHDLIKLNEEYDPRLDKIALMLVRNRFIDSSKENDLLPLCLQSRNGYRFQMTAIFLMKSDELLDVNEPILTLENKVMSLFQYAITQGCEQAVSYMLEKKSPNLRARAKISEGGNPRNILFLTLESDVPWRVQKVLLDKLGKKAIADMINQREGRCGGTCLHEAMYGEQFNINFLMENGADFLIMDNEGRLAYECGEESLDPVVQANRTYCAQQMLELAMNQLHQQIEEKGQELARNAQLIEKKTNELVTIHGAQKLELGSNAQLIEKTARKIVTEARKIHNLEKKLKFIMLYCSCVFSKF